MRCAPPPHRWMDGLARAPRDGVRDAHIAHIARADGYIFFQSSPTRGIDRARDARRARDADDDDDDRAADRDRKAHPIDAIAMRCDAMRVATRAMDVPGVRGVVVVIETIFVRRGRTRTTTSGVAGVNGERRGRARALGTTDAVVCDTLVASFVVTNREQGASAPLVGTRRVVIGQARVLD